MLLVDQLAEPTTGGPACAHTGTDADAHTGAATGTRTYLPVPVGHYGRPARYLRSATVNDARS